MTGDARDIGEKLGMRHFSASSSNPQAKYRLALFKLLVETFLCRQALQFERAAAGRHE